MVRMLTTTKLRQAKTLEATEIINSRNPCNALLIHSNESPSLSLERSLLDSTNIINLRTNDPAYIKEVKETGKTTACHCFIHKIAISACKFSNHSLFSNLHTIKECISKNHHTQQNSSSHIILTNI